MKFFTHVVVITQLILNMPLNGILDGLTTPIYIDTVYTFTDKEFARGSVYFNRGFDLPINGTIYLGINGGLVNGPINLNGGTVILTQPVALEKFGNFSGNGFISGNAFYSRIIKYTNRLLAGDGLVKFKSGMILQGRSQSAMLDEGTGTLDIREMGSGSTLEISGGRLILRRFLHNDTSPTSIWLTSVDVVASSQFTTIQSPTVYFASAPSIITQNRLAFKKISILGFTKLKIHPNSKIQFEQISMPYAGTRLEVQHSELDCIPTTTGYARMIQPYSHHLQGELAIDGKCYIGSSTKNILVFDRYAKLEILPGAQLTIKNNNHFILE